MALLLIAALLLATTPHVALGVSKKSSAAKKEKVATSPQKATTIPTTEDKVQADIDFCSKTLSTPGADMNSKTPSGMPLIEFLSVLYLNGIPTQAAMSYALMRQAEPNTLGNNNKTPLYYIVAYYACPELFTKQESQPAKENAETKAADTAQQANPAHTKETTLQLIELLLFFGANPLLADNDGISPLTLALHKQDATLMGLFEKYGWVKIVEETEEDQNNQHQDTQNEAATEQPDQTPAQPEQPDHVVIRA